MFGFPMVLDKMVASLLKAECHRKTEQRATIGIPNVFEQNRSVNFCLPSNIIIQALLYFDNSQHITYGFTKFLNF